MDQNNNDKPLEDSNSAVDFKVPVTTSPQEVISPEVVDERLKETLSFGPVVKQNRLSRLKKKQVIAGLAVGFSLLAVGTLGFTLTGSNNTQVSTSSQPTPELLGAVISLIDGNAQVSSDGLTWTDAIDRGVLSQGDFLRTDPASRLIITLDDGSIVRLNESSKVQLVSLDASNVEINNNVGEVYTRVVASDRIFSVNVEGTNYTALGTAFKTINKENDKGVKVYHSAVKVGDVDANITEGKQFFKKHSNPALLGIMTDVSIDEMKSDSFVLWNFEQDKQEQEFKDKLGYLNKISEQAPVTDPAPAGNGVGIKLNATKTDKGVVLKWTLSGVNSKDGFKIVRSKKSTTPTYGKDESNFVGADARSYTWKLGEGGIYNYRVCVFRPSESSCSNYSNAVKVETAEALPEAPVQGVVNLTLNGLVASWTDTGTSPNGWKLVVATSPSPIYGGNNVRQYYGGSPITIDENIKNEDKLDPGT